MFRAINGFTRERMKELICKHNNGTPATHSNSVDDFCVHFDPKTGNRDAVCCFLTDDFIEMEMKVLTLELKADELIGRFPFLEERMPLSVDGLVAMQNVHDECTSHDDDVRNVLCRWIDQNVLNESEYKNNDCDDDCC